MNSTGYAHSFQVHDTGLEHAEALDLSAAHTHAGAGILGGHGVELVIFTIGLVIFLILAARLYYREYQRSGRFRAPQ